MKSDMTSFRHAVTSSLIVGSSEKTTGHNDPADDCLVLQQGDFVPWDNPENILSKQVSFLGVSSFVSVFFIWGRGGGGGCCFALYCFALFCFVLLFAG